VIKVKEEEVIKVKEEEVIKVKEEDESLKRNYQD
jgi:hypothetical protein